MTHSTRTVWAVRGLVVVTAVLSLLPVVRLAVDWVEYVGVLGRPLEATPPRGYDGVRWTDDGAIVAAYVFPAGPGYAAGLRTGDVLARLDYEAVFTAADVDIRVERATGTVQTYEVVRGTETVPIDVEIARYPTFLYPLSQTLWVAAGWGFALVTFVHVLALLTVLPLARRSRRARRSAVLIAVGLLWVGGNLARLAWVSVGGASGSSAVARVLFDGLTLLALAGWTAFPALLLRHALLSDRRTRLVSRPVRPVLAVPPLLLGAGVSIATVRGHVGPLPPDAFVAPILFYVCVYVAAATAYAVARPSDGLEDGLPAPRWSRAGSVGVCVVAVLGALFAYNAIPVVGGEDDLLAAWFVTALQLLSLLPVVLVSLATLRYGRFDVLLARSVVALAAYGGLYTVVAGGAALLGTLRPGGTSPFWLGAFVVVVLAAASAVAPPVHRWAQAAFRTERQRARRRLDRFGERVPIYLSPQDLVDEAARAVGEALGPRSAVVFLRAGLGTPDERWARAAYRPEPPSFTLEDLDRVWDRIRTEGRVWARNDELNESSLPTSEGDRLRAFGVALAVPITTGEGRPAGLLVLGRKARRFSVYNVEDVDRLRALGAQLALAAERLGLIERERALVRQTAEAELVALRAQINPHFLFNALNTVAALIQEQPDQAEATVESLAGIFRDVLTASGRPTVPLADELRLVRRYLDVEQARFGEALRVEVDAESEALGREVPAFAVQTLVENAVKHGVERKRGGGAVAIRARVDERGDLVVEVTDTGAGIPALYPTVGGGFGDGVEGPPPEDTPDGVPPFFGDGLTNVARRLRQVYGDGDRLRHTSGPGGTRAVLRLPPSP